MRRIYTRSTPIAVLLLLGIVMLAGASVHPVAARDAVAKPALQVTGGPGDRLGFGQPAAEAEIAAWDIDIRPDGAGLPPGSGTVAEGAELYAQYCASCHSADGTESAFLMPFRTLVGPYDADTWPQAPLTIGNYWPYATTVFDFTRRAMPYDTPGVLNDDEVYAITAWLLHQNGLIPEDAVMDAETLPAVEMPARRHWIGDRRDFYPYQ